MPGDTPHLHPVDTDTLTPKAVGLAEAIAAYDPPYWIKIKSSVPARELYMERHVRLLDRPDEPVTTIYSSWPPWRAGATTAHGLLERAAREIGWMWYPIAPDGSDLPSSQAAREDDGVTRDQAMQIVGRVCPGHGITVDTWIRKATRGADGYPTPVRHSGYCLLWSAAEVRAWAIRLRHQQVGTVPLG